ncbi:MAG TPA: hypothetical protein VFF06_07100 [Polyangia bacterium]|nr:hypothetical protein [Polyangia bacterium]
MLARALVAAAVTILLTAGCQGPSWSVPLDKLDRVPLSVWIGGPRDVFASGGPLGSTGNALLLHYDGAVWNQIPVASPATLWWVFGFSATDVYAVGEQGTIVHWDGATVSTMTSGVTSTLYGVWGASPDDLWAVGGQPDVSGVLLHKDASGWHTVASPTMSGAYFKVWGSASNDVFVCGQGGTILHWDGEKWTSQPTGLPQSQTLFTIAGRAPNDVYAVGGLGTALALRYDGATWSKLADAPLAKVDSLAGVAVDSDGTLLLVGGNGAALRGKAGALVDESRLAATDDFHGAAIAAGQAFAVGGNYLAPAPAVRHGLVAHYGDSIPGMLR